MISDINFENVHYFIFSLICEGCIEGQQLRATFSNNKGRQANKPLEIAHSDVFGRMRDVAFVDDSTSIGSDLEMYLSGEKQGSHSGWDG